MSASARESGARLREEVQRALARSAKETTRVWFEQTVGNCGRWRGNDSASCRLAVKQACQARDGFGGEPTPAASVSGWGVAKYHAAFELMHSEYCDDKLAGMIMFEVRARRPQARLRRFTSSRHLVPRLSRARAGARATRPAFPAQRSPLPTTPPARTQELVLPDPSAADHLFPSRASSRRESDDADVRARRNAAETTRGAPTGGGSSGGFETETSDSEPGDDDARRGDPANEPTIDPPVRSAPKPTVVTSDDADASARARASASDRFPALRDAADVFWAADARRVRDWSTCDWMCSKVLAPYARAHPEAGDAARALLRWARDASAPPFARRAALVAFVNDVDGDDEATSAEARFGDGFVSLLAGTCAAALGVRARVPRRGGEDGGVADGGRFFAEALGEASDAGETSDPTTDPEAWVRIGARWMLSLCARALERAARGASRGARGAGTSAETTRVAVGGDASGAGVGSASAAKGTRPKPAKKPRSRRGRKRAAPA